MLQRDTNILVVFVALFLLKGTHSVLFFADIDYDCANYHDLAWFENNGGKVSEDGCIGVKDDNLYYDYADHCNNICFSTVFSAGEKPASLPYPRPDNLAVWRESGPVEFDKLFDDNIATCATVHNANGTGAVADPVGKVGIVKRASENQDIVRMKIIKEDANVSCKTANVLFMKKQASLGCEYLKKGKLISESGNECQVELECPGHHCQLELLLFDVESVSLCEIEKILLLD